MSHSSEDAGLSLPSALSAGHGGTPAPREAPAAPAPRLPEAPAEEKAPPPTPAAEEVDVWWGSYSGWTMLPSFLVCLVLTGFIAWGAWLLVPFGWRKAAFLAVAGLLWAGQCGRWFWRVFGYNYRLTNRRLFQDRGVMVTNTLRANLAEVTRVALEKNGWQRLAGLGRIRVVLQDGRSLRLDGVRGPARIVERLRECVEKARAWKAGEPGV